MKNKFSISFILFIALFSVIIISLIIYTKIYCSQNGNSHELNLTGEAVSNENDDIRINLSVLKQENSENTWMIYLELSECDRKDSSAGHTGIGGESFAVQSVNVLIEGDNGFLGTIQVEPEEFVWADKKISFDLSQYYQYDLKKAMGLDFLRSVYLEKGELVLSKQLEERQPELMMKGSANEDRKRQGGIMLPQGSYTISVCVQYKDAQKQNGMIQDITAQL